MENKVLDIRANKGGLCVGKNRKRKNDRWRERNTDMCCWDKHKQPLCISARYTNTFTVQSQVQRGSIAHSWPPPEGVFKRKYNFLCWRPPRVLRGRQHTSRSEEADSHLSSQRLPGVCTRVSLEPRSCWMLRFWRAQADDLQRSKLCVREWTFPATKQQTEDRINRMWEAGRGRKRNMRVLWIYATGAVTFPIVLRFIVGEIQSFQ